MQEFNCKQNKYVFKINKNLWKFEKCNLKANDFDVSYGES